MCKRDPSTRGRGKREGKGQKKSKTQGPGGTDVASHLSAVGDGAWVKKVRTGLKRKHQGKDYIGNELKRKTLTARINQAKRALGGAKNGLGATHRKLSGRRGMRKVVQEKKS